LILINGGQHTEDQARKHNEESAGGKEDMSICHFNMLRCVCVCGPGKLNGDKMPPQRCQYPKFK